MRRGLLTAAAIAPLLALAGVAQACPANDISTAGKGDVDIEVADGCTITPRINSGTTPLADRVAGLTLDSNNSITVDAGATISNKDVNNSTGILVEGGFTGNVSNSGTISLDMSYTPATESDGVTGGPFATGTGKIGIDVEGATPFDGSISNASGASITIQGTDSYGILLDAGITGNLVQAGTIAVTGNTDVGVLVKAAIGGNLTTSGSISANGVGAEGLVTNAAVGGQVSIGADVSSTAYRDTTAPNITVTEQLTAGQLQQGGAAVVIGGDVDQGVTITPTYTTGTGNSAVSTAEAIISEFGQAPALEIGAAGQAITIGDNAAESFGNLTSTTYQNYGLYIGGDVEAEGVYTTLDTPHLPGPVTATAVELGVAGGGSVDLSGGVYITGAVSATAVNATATGVLFNPGTTALALDNAGSVSAEVTSSVDTAQTVSAITIAPGASVTAIVNSGVIDGAISYSKQISGLSGTAYAILDQSGTVASITNSGVIEALVTPTNVNFTVNGLTTAIDVSNSTTGVAITQNPSTSYDGEPGAQFTGNFNNGTLTVKSVGASSGALVVGETLYGPGIPAATTITSEGTGTGGTGTYTVSTTTNVSTESMTAAGEAPEIAGGVVFGGGNNSLTINSGNMTGFVTEASASGNLSISVAQPAGSSAIVDITAPVVNGVGAAEGHTLTSLYVGAGGELLAATDPSFAIGGSNPTALFDLAPSGGTATFQSGAQIGLTLDALQSAHSATYVFVQTAAPGDLTVGTLDETTLVNAPYLYSASTSTSANGQNLDVTLSLKTPRQLGLDESGASAFEGIFNALQKNNEIAGALIAATTKYSFLQLYDQLLPNQTIGTFESIEAATQKISNLTEQTPDNGTRIGGGSAWLQEINTTIKRDDGDTLGETDQMFGLVGGYERMGPAGGAIGVTLAYLNVGSNTVDEPITGDLVANLAEAGAYYRRAWGGLRFSVRAGGGYGWFNERRPFVTSGVSDTAYGDWNGVFADGHAGLEYEAHLSRFYLRPELSVDYLYLNQSSFTETGGGPGLDMAMAQRVSDRMTAAALMTFGAQYGKTEWFRPEIYGGYRAVAFGNLADTVASFDGGEPFSLAPGDVNGGWMVVGFALKAGTPLSYVAIEGEADFNDNEQRYDIYLAGRALF